MPSEAFKVFDKYTVREINTLANIFSELNTGKGQNSAYGLVNGGLVILVSGWETYCEDVSKESVKKLASTKNLTFGKIPQTIQRKILKYAHQKNFHSMDPLETRLAKLPGEGWRNVFCGMVENHLQNFNTPKFNKGEDEGEGKDLKKLFSLFLLTDVKEVIQELTGINGHGEEIDDLIRIRGDIAHRGEPEKEDKFNAKKLRDYLTTFQKACAAIDAIIWQDFRLHYGVTPWNITIKIKSHLPCYENIESLIKQHKKDEKNAD